MRNVILLGSQFFAENSNGNFQRTILKPVILENYKNQFTENDKEKMQSLKISFDQSYSMWAVNQKFHSIFEKIKSGDIVLFYSRNKYHHCARVKHVLQGKYPNIAEQLWNEAKYENLLILDSLTPIDFSRKIIHENMGEKIENPIITGIKIATNPVPEFVEQLLIRLSEKQEMISGDKGTTDQIAQEDHLSRESLIQKLARFYIDYTKRDDKEEIIGKVTKADREKINESKSKNHFFLGVFGKWGKGKSSFIHLLQKEIENQTSSQNKNTRETYIIANIDCSLVDQKETLWLNILNKIIYEMEKKRRGLKNDKKDFGSDDPFKLRTKIRLPGYSHFELWFNVKNIQKVLLGKKLLILFYIILLIGSFTLIDPPSEFKLNGKNIGGLITLTTLLVTIAKTLNLRLGQIFLPNKYTQVTNSYFKSKDEFEQLLQITEELLKEDHKLRILITLDEVDRMNKLLLPELMECFQLFKAIEQPNRVSLQFLFSFNHDIVFPNIGKSIAMNDPHLLVHSFPESFLSRDIVYGSTRVNFYQLGKEYMDKYLDLSVYLDDVPSYDHLVNKIFKVEYRNDTDVASDDTTKESIYSDRNNDLNSMVSEDDKGNLSIPNSENMEAKPKMVSSFTSAEIQIIKSSIRKHKEHVEPRKLIRLNNALIIIKNIDLNNKKINEESEDELAIFVSDFLRDDEEEKKGETETSNTYNILKSAHYFLDKRPVAQQMVENQIQYRAETMCFSMNRSDEVQTEHD